MRGDVCAESVGRGKRTFPEGRAQLVSNHGAARARLVIHGTGRPACSGHSERGRDQCEEVGEFHARKQKVGGSSRTEPG